MHPSILERARGRAGALQIGVSAYLRILVRNAQLIKTETRVLPRSADDAQLVREKVTLGLPAKERADIERELPAGMTFTDHLECLVSMDVNLKADALVIYAIPQAARSPQ